MTINLYLPGCGSLKEKRMILRSIKDKVSKKFNVSIAEVDYNDKWQRSQIGIAQVGNDYGFLGSCMTNIFNLIDTNAQAEIVDHSVEYL